VTVFVGIDLAWGSRNASGICVVTPGGCTLGCSVVSAEGLVEMLDGLGPDVVVGIDAPLIVEAGRWAEAALARRMGRFGVYAHSSVAAVNNGYDQGVRLAAGLSDRGFSVAPRMMPGAAGRFALEVYPHAGHVVMFGLPRIMPYKQKRGRTAAGIHRELCRYRGELRRWMEREAPGLAATDAVAELLSEGPLAGAARKRHEDQLDALTCALLARVAWRDGVGPDDVLGDGERGYIAVPGLSHDPRFAVALDRDGVN
jgi:predicted RNase H-like nuclease